MGANKYPTVEPSNVDMETKVNRLVRDLESLEATSNVDSSGTGQNTVKFESQGPTPGDLPVDVLRVLADHDAFIPRHQDSDREWWVAIHLE